VRQSDEQYVAETVEAGCEARQLGQRFHHVLSRIDARRLTRGVGRVSVWFQIQFSNSQDSTNF
jgi:hypothetical protein